MLVFAQQIKTSPSVQLLVGQTFDTNTYVYDQLQLSELYSTLCQDFTNKDNLRDFIEQIQEVTNMISYGLRAIGLIFPEKQSFANLNILKKITQAFNSQEIIFGTVGSYEKFDLKTLKTSQVKDRLDKNLVPFELRWVERVVIPITGDHQASIKEYLTQIKQIINTEKVAFNGEIQLDDKNLPLEDLKSEERVRINLLRPQSEIEQSTLKQVIQGNVIVQIYANQYATVQHIKNLMYFDLEDQLNLRVVGEENEVIVLQRVELQFQQHNIKFQAFKEYEKDPAEYETLANEMLKNFQNYQITKVTVNDQKPKRVIKEVKEIDISSPKPVTRIQPNINEIQEETKKDFNSLIFAGIVVSLLLGLGLVYL